MSRAAQLAAVLYEAETANTGWAEATSTFGVRLPVIGEEVDLSGLTQDPIEPMITVPYAQDGQAPFPGVQDGEFVTKIWLPGHGSTTAGAVTAAAHETLLGLVFGAAAQNGNGTTCNGVGDEDTIPTTAANGLTAGGIFWGGVDQDTRGDAQPGVVSAHAANSLESLVKLPATLAAADVIGSSVMVHFNESPTAAAIGALRSARFRAQTANQQADMHGCYPRRIKLSGLNTGEAMQAEIGWGVSRWARASGTFPPIVAPDAFVSAPCAGGSLFCNTKGTSTRVTYRCHDFQVDIDLGITSHRTTGGVTAFQGSTHAHRGKARITVTFVVEQEDAGTQTWLDRYLNRTALHMLWNASSAAIGKRVAAYAPNACVATKPQLISFNGMNCERITLRCYTNTTTTTELIASAFRLGFG